MAMLSMARLGVLGSLALALACGGGQQGDDDGTETDASSSSSATATTTATTSATTTMGTVSLTAGTTASTTATTTGIPGEPCCAPQGGPGCAEDPGIAQCVCETDRYCCETNWDEVCVGRIVELGCGVCDGGPGTVTTTAPDTGDVTTGTPPQNVGPCCDPHPETGCEVPSVSECVCSYEPSCCEDSWREYCVEAVDLYGCGVCPPSGTSTTTGDPPDNTEACCDSHASTGCEYPAIADCVCLSYPGCCTEAWDELCVDAVNELGCGVCPP